MQHVVVVALSECPHPRPHPHPHPPAHPHPHSHPHPHPPAQRRRQAMLRFITFIIIEAYSPFNICRIYLGTFHVPAENSSSS